MANHKLERITMRTPDGTMPHIGLKPGEVAPHVLTCGSLERVEKSKELLEHPKRFQSRRGFVTYTGAYKGLSVTVATTGVGSPSMVIATEELFAVGGEVVIRCGSCAAFHENVPVGGMVVATGSVREEGTSKFYAPIEYPAVADFNLTMAICRAADRLNYSYQLGIVRASDDFYVEANTPDLYKKWKALGVLAKEMEASALFVMASVLGFPAGLILTAGTNYLEKESAYAGQKKREYLEGEMRMLETGMEALRLFADTIS